MFWDSSGRLLNGDVLQKNDPVSGKAEGRIPIDEEHPAETEYVSGRFIVRMKIQKGLQDGISKVWITVSGKN